MHKFSALIFSIVLTAAAGGAAVRGQTQAQAAKPAGVAANPRTAAPMRMKPSSIELHRQIASQHEKFQRLLPAETKRRIDLLVPEFEKETRRSKPGTNFRALAETQVRRTFQKLSPQQADVLTFELLKGTFDQMQDSSGDMSQMDQLTLQQAMDKKSQFESIFSNLLKSFSDTQDSIVQNIK
jgi:hypothetical protein